MSISWLNPLPGKDIALVGSLLHTPTSSSHIGDNLCPQVQSGADRPRPDLTVVALTLPHMVSHA